MPPGRYKPQIAGLFVAASAFRLVMKLLSMVVFVAPASAYIPPETRHNVKNTGTEPLEYVYVVAPTR